jgi:hypothetical protein
MILWLFCGYFLKLFFYKIFFWLFGYFVAIFRHFWSFFYQFHQTFGAKIFILPAPLT